MKNKKYLKDEQPIQDYFDKIPEGDVPNEQVDQMVKDVYVLVCQQVSDEERCLELTGEWFGVGATEVEEIVFPYGV